MVSSTANHSQPTSPTLPPEVISLIIKGASPHELDNYSLISRAWTCPCQEALFSTLYIDPRKELLLYDALEDSKNAWVGRCIRDLVLGRRCEHGDGNNPQEVDIEDIEPLDLDGLEEEDPSSKALHPKFPVFLRSLERLASLRVTLCGINWTVLSPDALDAFLHAFSRPSFKRLEVNPDYSEHPFALLPFCYHLETLTVRSEYQGCDEPDASDPSLPSVMDASNYNLADKPSVLIKSLNLSGISIIHAFTTIVAGNLMQLDKTASLDNSCKVHLSYEQDTCDPEDHEPIFCGDRVGEFLKAFGSSIGSLTLQHGQEWGHHLIPQDGVQCLTNLRVLNLEFWGTDLCPGDIESAAEWFCPFLLGLGAPDQLEVLQLHFYVSRKCISLELDQEDDLVDSIDRFFTMLEGALQSRFARLENLYIYMYLQGARRQGGEVIYSRLRGCEESAQRRLQRLLGGANVQVHFDL